MAAQSPFEIIVGPLAIYLAPAIEAEDDVDSAPSGNWGLLGTSGMESYAEAGISLNFSQTIRQSFVVGATGPVKANRQQEQLTVGVSLMDLSAAEFTKILNNTTKSTDTSPNIDYIGVRRGPDVTLLSLTARGAGLSPSGATLDMHFYSPRVYQSGDPAMTFSKDEDAMLAATFTALENLSAATDEQRFGRWVVETS